MEADDVVSISIDRPSHGVTTLRIVRQDADGVRRVSRRHGPETEMRRLARALAVRHGLEPVWDDAGSARAARHGAPPAYTPRPRAASA